MSAEAKLKRPNIIDALKILVGNSDTSSASLSKELIQSQKNADKMGAQMGEYIVEEKPVSKSAGKGKYSEEGLNDFANRLRGKNINQVKESRQSTTEQNKVKEDRIRD